MTASPIYLRQLELGPMQNYVYLIGDPNTREAAAVDAAWDIDTILDVPGVDAIQFGPADYSSSAGYLGQWMGPGVEAELLQLKDRIRSRGVPCGIMATDVANGVLRQQQGFQLVGVGSDAGLMIRSSREALQALRGKDTSK